MVFDGMDANQDGTLSLEEVVETYRRVHAEVVLDGDLKVDEEEMKVAPDNLDRIDLRPAAPGAEVNSILPFYADGSSSASALSHQWKQVCDALAKQSMYLPPDEQYQVQDALRFTGERLLGSRLVDKKFGEGLAIGSIIAGLQLPTPVLVSAVLLPCVRERSASIQEVRDRFGPVVGSMVEDSVWLSQLPDRVGLLDDDGSRFLREYMVAASRDHRAVIVMLADRLNALRKIEEAPLYDQHLKALESLQVFSPLAHALGVGKWLWELEDLSFRALFPDSYTSVEQWQLELWEVSSNMMEQAKVDVLKALNENDFLLEHVERYAITSRRKSVFSTFKKMFRSNKKLEDVKDVFAMRVVIGLKSQFRSDDSVQVRTCTEAYGAVRKALVGWEEPRGRFKDYVTHPKPNGYQSIHTTLDSPLKLPLEVQIRTEEMHAAAEFGDASHNLYKGGIKSLSAVQNFADMVRKSNVAALAPADSDLSEENSEEQRDLDALEFSNEAAEASSLELSLDSSDAIKRKNERSVEGEGTGAGFLDEDELRNMILTAPGVNDDVSMGGSEEEHAWQLDSLGQDLLFVVPAFERSSIEADLRQSSEIVLAASQDAAAAYAAGQETPLKLDRVLADLMAAAEDGSGKETEEFEAQRRFLRQQGIDVIKRQDVLRTMLDSNKARLFDPDEVMAKLLDEWDERLSDERSREPRQDAGGEQPRGKLRCELLEEPAGMFSSMEFERSSST
uniref:EF-hand domain-containing protein n=1 Tax=Guillardia theta TaxID=55529 RepID=A0A7S4NTH2_GUITH